MKQLLKFNHEEVMCRQTHEMATKKGSDSLHASQTLQKKDREALDLKDNDELFVLAYTDNRSVSFKIRVSLRQRSNKDSIVSDWSLLKEYIDILGLSEGSTLHTLITKVENIESPEDGVKILAQRPLPTDSEKTTVGATSNDPTGGTWLFIGDQKMSYITSAGDNVSGKVTNAKGSSPHRQFFNFAPGDTVRVRAELDGESVECERKINKTDHSVTVPRKSREKLGVEPGDTVRVYIHTSSIVDNPPERASETAEVTDLTDSDPAVETDAQPSTETAADGGATPMSSAESPITSPSPNQSDSGSPEQTRDSQAVVLKSERQRDEWPNHYIRGDPDTADETVCGQLIETAIPDEDGAFGDVRCVECWLDSMDTITDDTLTEILRSHISIENPAADEITIHREDLLRIVNLT